MGLKRAVLSVALCLAPKEVKEQYLPPKNGPEGEPASQQPKRERASAVADVATAEGEDLPPQASKSTSTPIRPVHSFAYEHRQKIIAYQVAIGGLILGLVLMVALNMTNRFDDRVMVLGSDGTIHIGVAEELNERHPLLSQTVIHATNTILLRAPNGLLLGEQALALLSSPARSRLEGDLQDRRQDFGERQIRWVPEITRVDLRSRDAGRYFAVAEGIVREVGQLRGRLYSDERRFTIAYVLQRNPNLGQRGQWPWVIFDFEIRFQ